MGLACTKTHNSDDALARAWTTKSHNKRILHHSQRLRKSIIFFSVAYQHMGESANNSIFNAMMLPTSTVVPFCLDASMIMHSNSYTLGDVIDLFCTTNSSLLSISKTSIRLVEFNDHALDWDLPLNWVPATSLRDPILLVCHY